MAHGLAAVVAGGQAHRKRTGSRAPPRRSRRAGPGRLAAARVEGGAAMLCGGGGDVAENTLPHIEQSGRSASFKRVQTGQCRCSMRGGAGHVADGMHLTAAGRRERPSEGPFAVRADRARGWRADLHHRCPATSASASSHIPSSSARKSCYEGARTLRDPQSFFFEQGTGTGGTIILLALRVIR